MTISAPDFAHLSLATNVVVFSLAATAIGVAGWYLATTANRIAQRTGLGQALTGAIFLGASTSLSGTVTSITAAADGHPELAFANAIGGISAQTAFLAIADITYVRANLEHAAASVANIMQGALLVVMLGIILAAMSAPEISVFGIHPASVVLPLAYVYGMRRVSQAQMEPMWLPQHTAETREDRPSSERTYGGALKLWFRFAILSVAVAIAGWVIAKTGIVIARSTGISETGVGAMFSAVSTSLPELVTCVAAVRQGALTLAVSDIIGGNVFDTLFVSLADVAYRDGSIFHAAGAGGRFATALPVVLTGVMLMGLVRREKRGIANIGFESFFVLLLYVCGAVVMLAS
ncbi:MAG: sodium:calcium antiporter [Betaproteobacteria bacterium]|nr:sodium:calcium antiporter [Betaproteobacteria bacterium]